MVKELQYTNIKRVLDNIMDHPLLRDVSLEQAVRYTIRFIGLFGFPKLYQDKIEDLKVEDFRTMLPCDLVSIIQVKDLRTGICLRSMTDNFAPGMTPHPNPPCPPKHIEYNVDVKKPREWYIPAALQYETEPAFKTQGRVLYTSFPEGMIQVAYKSIPVDDDGFPLLVDNENYLAALEAYIKKQVFTIKFDQQKIPAGVLQNAQQDYAWAAKTLTMEFVMPSQSEMESLTRMWNTMIPKMREFDNGFRNLGNREYLRKH